jgi:hypothetical protein
MARIIATFSIWSKVVTPERISAVLSSTADHMVSRGADRTPPRPVPDAYGWHLTCKRQDESDVEKILKELLDRVRSFEARLPVLAEMDSNLDIRVGLSIRPFEDTLSLYFAADTIATLFRLKSSFDMDFFPAE